MTPGAEPREWDHGEFVVATDPGRLDREYVVRTLQATYWAAGRSREVILRALDHSLCFGVYRRADGAQVGFARVVTDFATFSWLCDVVVDEAWRGRGLGKALVAAVLAHPDLATTNFTLGTRDAHGLYEQFGFVREEQMKRRVHPAG